MYNVLAFRVTFEGENVRYRRANEKSFADCLSFSIYRYPHHFCGWFK